MRGIGRLVDNGDDAHTAPEQGVGFQVGNQFLRGVDAADLIPVDPGCDANLRMPAAEIAHTVCVFPCRCA